MRRVYAVWVLKKVFSMAVLRALIFIAAIAQFSREVFVAQVFRNMPGTMDIGANSKYLYSAFLHTEHSVQIYLTLIGIAVVWFVAEKMVKKIPNFGMVGSKL